MNKIHPYRFQVDRYVYTATTTVGLSDSGRDYFGRPP